MVPKLLQREFYELVNLVREGYPEFRRYSNYPMVILRMSAWTHYEF